MSDHFAYISPGYGTNLLVSRTGHHISRVKATLDLFSTVGYFNYKFSLNPKKMRVFKYMFCSLAEFSSIFHPAVMDAYGNLGGLGPFCNKWGGGGGRSGVIFFLGGGVVG